MFKPPRGVLLEQDRVLLLQYYTAQVCKSALNTQKVKGVFRVAPADQVCYGADSGTAASLMPPCVSHTYKGQNSVVAVLLAPVATGAGLRTEPRADWTIGHPRLSPLSGLRVRACAVPPSADILFTPEAQDGSCERLGPLAHRGCEWLPKNTAFPDRRVPWIPVCMLGSEEPSEPSSLRSSEVVS